MPWSGPTAPRAAQHAVSGGLQLGGCLAKRSRRLHIELHPCLWRRNLIRPGVRPEARLDSLSGRLQREGLHRLEVVVGLAEGIRCSRPASSSLSRPVKKASSGGVCIARPIERAGLAAVDLDQGADLADCPAFPHDGFLNVLGPHRYSHRSTRHCSTRHCSTRRGSPDSGSRTVCRLSDGSDGTGAQGSFRR